jgi:hypothetical protein
MGSAGASGVLVQGDVADPGAAESLAKEAAQKLKGSDGQHWPVFRRGAGAAWDYGETGEPWNVVCGVWDDSARISRCGEGMGGVAMDAHPAGQGGRYCRCLCAAVQL